MAEKLDEGRELETAPENPSGDDGATGSSSSSSVSSLIDNTSQQVWETVNANSQWADDVYRENTDTTENQDFGFHDYDETETNDSSDDSFDDNDDDDGV